MNEQTTALSKRELMDEIDRLRSELDAAKANEARLAEGLNRVKQLTGWPTPVWPADVAVAYLEAAIDDIETTHYPEAKTEIIKAIRQLSPEQRRTALSELLGPTVELLEEIKPLHGSCGFPMRVKQIETELARLRAAGQKWTLSRRQQFFECVTTKQTVFKRHSFLSKHNA